MRALRLVVLALWFFALRLKPVKAAGSGTWEVIMIMHRSARGQHGDVCSVHGKLKHMHVGSDALLMHISAMM